MARTGCELTGAQWVAIEALLPCSDGKRGRPFRDGRQVIEGIVFKFRSGCAWRDVPEKYGPWQTLWKRHDRFSNDGTWDRVHGALMAQADAAGEIQWMVSADSSSVRVHQHGATLRRWDDDQPGVGSADVIHREAVVSGGHHTGG